MKRLLLPAFCLAFALSTNAQYWSQVQKIVALDRGTTDEFGYAASISGNMAIVGAHKENEDATGNNYMSYAGSAYIYLADSSGIATCPTGLDLARILELKSAGQGVAAPYLRSSLRIRRRR